MKKQLLSAALLAAGLTGIGAAQAALIDIGTNQTVILLGNWKGNTIKQQDKLFTVDQSQTDLADTTSFTFDFNIGATGDQHGIKWGPVNTGGPGALPLTYQLAYQVDITAEAQALGARFTTVTLGVDTSTSCFSNPTSLCSNATKQIYDDNTGASLLDTITAAQGIGGVSTLPVAGKTSLYILENVNWNNSTLFSISNIFIENQGVPEPDSIALLGIGLVSMFFGKRAMKK